MNTRPSTNLSTGIKGVAPQATPCADYRDKILERVIQLVDQINNLKSRSIHTPNSTGAQEINLLESQVRVCVHKHEKDHGYRGIRKFVLRFESYQKRLTLDNRLQSLSRDSRYLEFCYSSQKLIKRDPIGVINDCQRRFGLPVPVRPCVLAKPTPAQRELLRAVSPSPLVLHPARRQDQALIDMHKPENPIAVGHRRILLSIDPTTPLEQQHDDIDLICAHFIHRNRVVGRKSRQRRNQGIVAARTGVVRECFERKLGKEYMENVLAAEDRQGGPARNTSQGHPNHYMSFGNVLSGLESKIEQALNEALEITKEELSEGSFKTIVDMIAANIEEAATSGVQNRVSR